MTINLVDSPSSSGTDYWFRPTHLACAQYERPDEREKFRWIRTLDVRPLRLVVPPPETERVRPIAVAREFLELRRALTKGASAALVGEEGHVSGVVLDEVQLRSNMRADEPCNRWPESWREPRSSCSLVSHSGKARSDHRRASDVVEERRGDKLTGRVCVFGELRALQRMRKLVHRLEAIDDAV